MANKLIVLILFFLVNVFVKAQTCCSGGIPLSNNIGLNTQEKGTFLIGVNYDYNNLNTLNNENEKLDDNARLRITHSALVNVGYSITNNIAVEGLFTWVNQRRKITQFGNENLDQTSGVSDAVLLLKYNFKDLIGDNSNVALGVGTKIPIGSSTETNEQGITYNADLQPGSNAWDIVYWSSIAKNFNFRPSLNFSSRLIYRSTGTNDSYFGDSTYKFGNEFQFFLGVSDQFLLFKTLIDPSLTFKYRNAQKDKTGDFDLDSTGGDWIFIIPNVSINISPTIAFSTRLELPIYARVDGTQLTPTYRLTTGILVSVFDKTTLPVIN